MRLDETKKRQHCKFNPRAYRQFIYTHMIVLCCETTEITYRQKPYRQPVIRLCQQCQCIWEWCMRVCVCVRVSVWMNHASMGAPFNAWRVKMRKERMTGAGPQVHALKRNAWYCWHWERHQTTNPTTEMQATPLLNFLINFFSNIHILYIWEKLYKKWLKNTHTMILDRSSFDACIHNKIYCQIMGKKTNECIYSHRSRWSYFEEKNKEDSALKFLSSYLLNFHYFCTVTRSYRGKSKNEPIFLNLRSDNRDTTCKLLASQDFVNRFHKYITFFRGKYGHLTDQVMSRYSLFIINFFHFIFEAFHCTLLWIMSFYWYSTTCHFSFWLLLLMQATFVLSLNLHFKTRQRLEVRIGTVLYVDIQTAFQEIGILSNVRSEYAYLNNRISSEIIEDKRLMKFKNINDCDPCIST